MDEGNDVVVNTLREKNALLACNEFVHRYPFDWRTRKPIMLRATQQWFAQLQEIKQLALEALKNVKVCQYVK